MSQQVVARPSLDTRPPIRFVSWREVVGALAALAPFAIAVTAGRLRVVDGRPLIATVDLAALIGGGIGFLAGVLAVAALGRTAPGRRTARALVGLALAAVGAWQVQRGALIPCESVTAYGPYPGLHVASAMPGARALATRLDRAVQPSLPPVARQVLDAWRAGRIDALAARMAPERAPQSLAALRDRLLHPHAALARRRAAAVAELGELGAIERVELMPHTGDAGALGVDATSLAVIARFTRGRGIVLLRLADLGGHPTIAYLQVLPIDLPAPIEPPATTAVRALGEPAVQRRFGLAQRFGAVVSVQVLGEGSCGGRTPLAVCRHVTMRVVGTAGADTTTAFLHAERGRWRVALPHPRLSSS